MNYLELNDYRYQWFFKHKDMPLPDQSLLAIKPLAESYANQIWHQIISKNANHPDLFARDDWPNKAKTWQVQGQWQAAWDGQDSFLPDEIEEHIEWELNTVVYFCYHSDNILETSWEVFAKHWKNFLFLDNGPILFAKRRKEVVQFFDDGSFKLGIKPDH